MFHRKELNLISRYMASTSKVNFCISKLFIQSNTSSYCVFVCVVLFVFVSLCVISNQSTSENHVIHVRPSGNLMPCCIKHTARFCWYLSTKARQVLVHNIIIKQNSTLDVA